VLKVFEAFSGVGAQEMALRNIKVAHESVGVAEVNESAILSYAAIHAENISVPDASPEEMQNYMEKLNIPLNDKGERVILKNKRLKNLYEASMAIKNIGDISKVDLEDIPEMDLFTYSFPCQSISHAGLGKGLTKGSGTRSSLLWECERIIADKKPSYLLMENVKALVSKKHKPDFDLWCDLLDEMGYDNYWEVLNSKDFGIPQNRERVFMVSIRKDLKQGYRFPDKKTLNVFIKDILEQDVPEKYYLKREQVDNLVLSDKLLEEKLRQRVNNDFVELKNNRGSGLTKMGNINPSGKGIGGEVYDSENSLSPTVMAGHDYIHVGIPVIAASRGRYPENPKLRTSGLPTKQHLELNQTGLSNTLTSVQKDNYVVNKNEELLGIDVHPLSKKLEYRSYKQKDIANTMLATDYKCPKTIALYQKSSSESSELKLSDFLTIRKLTPKECWRLMGFDDKDTDKAKEVVSNTQLYKQAGNSIVVPVLEGIFANLLLEK